jgi:hypothetical protein
MLTLGILSIIQIVFLPGMAAACYIKRLHWADRVLLAVPLSLVINYALVLLLTIIGLYQTTSMLFLVAIELVFLVAGIRKAAKDEKPYRSSEPNGPLADGALEWFVYFLVFVLLFFYNIAAWKAISMAFYAPDVLISWNRWALSWYHGMTPHIAWGYPVGSYTYPQGVPIFFSETYQFIGDSRIQYFAKATAIIMPYIGLITFLRIPHLLSSIRARRIALLSVPIFLMVQSTGYHDVNFLFEGYVDPIMAYYGVILIYLVVLLHSRASSAKIGAADNFVYLAVILASTPALIKQPGIVVSVLFPALWYRHYGRSLGDQALSKLLYSYLIVVLVAGHWYIYKGIQIFSGTDYSAYDAYADLMVQWDKRPSTAFEMIFNKIGWPWLVPFLLSMAYPTIRLLVLWGVLPGFIFWASFASYDMRSFFFVLPSFAIALSAGCYRIYELARYRRHFLSLFLVWLVYFAYERYNNAIAWVTYLDFKSVTTRTAIYNILLLSLLWFFVVKKRASGATVRTGLPSFRLIAILSAVVVVLGVWGSSDRINRTLVNRAIAESHDLVGPDLVRFLSEHFREDGGGGYVACREQMFSNVPDLQERFVFPGCEASVMYNDPRVRYCLISSPPGKELEDLVARPELRKIGEQGGWGLYEKRSWSQRESPLSD